MEDSSGQSLLFQSILLLILTLLTAFFSASEMAGLFGIQPWCGSYQQHGRWH